MTRINCVPVQELSGPHLVAEYRELPRVFALAQKAAARGIKAQPCTYTLGKGHLLFFYTRLDYLARRHADLIEEMRRRGYKPTFTGIRREDFPAIPDDCWGSWKPTAEAQRLNRERIQERRQDAENNKAAKL
ncbi:pyrimidine dimer DNA glycosylase/endonuclease V [Bordetella muralis]|uniref:pyrimidine dimer DNA glycosylase/endonuclease V n=1 Tax=Bordetella muralis TaxID=1649130 RepID=UPI0039F092B3